MSADTEKKQGFYERYWTKEESKGWFPSRESDLHPIERTIFNSFDAGSSVLDYGCGDGRRYGRALQEQGLEYTGYDISESAITDAVKNGVNANKLNADSTTNLDSGCMDSAICFEVLEHVIDTEAVLREIGRVLKEGGRLAISVPNPGLYTGRLEFLLTGFFCPGGSPVTSRVKPWMDPHIRFFTPRTFRRMVESNGFRVERFYSERFRLTSAPILWRCKRLGKVLDTLVYPLGFLGKILPSLFSARFFVVARPE